MNIAIDIRNIGRQRTGSEVVVLEMTKKLIALYPENTYYLLTDTSDKSVHAHITTHLDLAGKDYVHVTTCETKSRVTWVVHSVPQFLAQHDIDIFWTEYIVPFFIPKEVKVVTHIHDVSFQAVRELIGKKDLFFLDVMIPRSLRRADAVIAVSKFTEYELKKYYPSIDDGRIKMIYNACGEQFHQRGEDMHKKAVQEKYHLPEKYIFALGTMQPRKNIPRVVEAFARIAHKIPGVDLVLSGKRGHHFDDAIKDVIEEYPDVKQRIQFTGYIDAADLPMVYQSAHLFVFPSLYEGFGIPLVEAFWSEVPVVASKTPVHEEIAQKAAHFFAPLHIDQCAQALYDGCIDENLRRTLLESAAERRTVFSWENAAREMHDVFQVLCDD